MPPPKGKDGLKPRGKMVKEKKPQRQPVAERQAMNDKVYRRRNTRQCPSPVCTRLKQVTEGKKPVSYQQESSCSHIFRSAAVTPDSVKLRCILDAQESSLLFLMRDDDGSMTYAKLRRRRPMHGM
jgi:hypothetical protein